MTGTARTVLPEEFPACFGPWTGEIEIGDGWVPLVRGLCRYLLWMADDQRLAPPRVVQVKEKLGGLRFYVVGPTEAQSQVIGFAEALSLTICESCGATVEVTVEGAWLKAMCPECRDRLTR